MSNQEGGEVLHVARVQPGFPRQLLGDAHPGVARRNRVGRDGGYTPGELNRFAEDLVNRVRFYDTACVTNATAVQGTENARARRCAERKKS